MTMILTPFLLLGGAAYAGYAGWRHQRGRLPTRTAMGGVLIGLGAFAWGVIGVYGFDHHAASNFGIVASSLLLVGVLLERHGKARPRGPEPR
jgi:hypothetical protein